MSRDRNWELTMVSSGLDQLPYRVHNGYNIRYQVFGHYLDGYNQVTRLLTQW